MDQAAAFDVVGIEAGSTHLVVGALPLAEAVPEQFAQLQMFGAIDGGVSCLDLLSESLEDAIGARVDSEIYDDKLLASFGRFGKVFRHGVDSIDFQNGRSVRLDALAVHHLETLQRNIPPDQRVIVTGKLDELRQRPHVHARPRRRTHVEGRDQ